MKREIVLLKRAGLLPAGQGNAAVIFGVKLFGSSTTAEGVINALPCPAPSRAGVPGTAASPSEPGLRPGAPEGEKVGVHVDSRQHHCRHSLQGARESAQHFFLPGRWERNPNGANAASAASHPTHSRAFGSIPPESETEEGTVCAMLCRLSCLSSQDNLSQLTT